MSKNKASLTSGIGGNLQHPTGGEIEFVHTLWNFKDQLCFALLVADCGDCSSKLARQLANTSTQPTNHSPEWWVRLTRGFVK